MVSPARIQMTLDEFFALPETMTPTGERCMEQDGKLFGPPDLCIEILSPSTARKDRTKKFNAYESAGVREFWIIEPTLNALEQWILSDNEFEFQGVYHEPQTFVSPALNGATVALSDIFPQTS